MMGYVGWLGMPATQWENHRYLLIDHSYNPITLV